MKNFDPLVFFLLQSRPPKNRGLIVEQLAADMNYNQQSFMQDLEVIAPYSVRVKSNVKLFPLIVCENCFAIHSTDLPLTSTSIPICKDCNKNESVGGYRSHRAKLLARILLSAPAYYNPNDFYAELMGNEEEKELFFSLEVNAEAEIDLEVGLIGTPANSLRVTIGDL